MNKYRAPFANGFTYFKDGRYFSDKECTLEWWNTDSKALDTWWHNAQRYIGQDINDEEIYEGDTCEFLDGDGDALDDAEVVTSIFDICCGNPETGEISYDSRIVRKIVAPNNKSKVCTTYPKMVRCIDDRKVVNSNKVHITQGNLYQVFNEKTHLFDICDDIGNRAKYASFRFEDVIKEADIGGKRSVKELLLDLAEEFARTYKGNGVWETCSLDKSKRYSVKIELKDVGE